MDNIIDCRLDSTCKEIYTGIWQHDYGQILRITGVDLPKAVEVQFSLRNKGGDTLTRIGTTVDGVTEVKVPDSFLKNENCTQNYLIYAWIYVTDDTSGNTEYQIIMHVKTRHKPEEPTEEPLPEPNIFHETVEAVNASADRAEMAEQNAKESAEKAETTLADMKETVGNLTETVEQAEKLDGNLDKKLEQGENIVANIKDKLDAPLNPLVGKYLRVKAVNEDGVPELEWVDEPSGGSSLDIQIDGESIVQDGVAEIPMIAEEKSGLIQFRRGYGLQLIGNYLLVKGATETEITNRTGSRAPILADSTFDYAVKAAMCDGKGAAWTAEEQANARERIGIKWKQLVDVTTEEDATNFIYTFDACNEIIVMISGNSTSNRIDCFSDEITNFYFYYFFLKNRASTNCIHIHPRICSMRYIECGAVSEDTPNSNNAYVMINEASLGKCVKSLKDKIDNLTFRIGDSGILNAGSRIQVWGR